MDPADHAVSRARRVWPGILLAAAFGIAAGWFKGNDPGLRGSIGNLSAPWLLVPLLTAVRCQKVVQGAIAGLASTLAALAGFYTALTAVLAGQLGGGGPFAELITEVQANRIYLLGGLVTGPVVGAVGVWLGRGRATSLWLAVGALLVGEIAVVALVSGHQLLPSPFYFSWAVANWAPYAGESIVGAAIMLAAVWRRHRQAPAR
jgi:hypothetical protein